MNDPGNVTLNVGENWDRTRRCNIEYEWDNHSQGAYDKTNRDGWRKPLLRAYL